MRARLPRPPWAVVLLGCASTPTQNRACVDMINAVATAFQQKCGADLNAEVRALTDRLAAGDCANVIGVRDEPSLRTTCFAAVADASCAELEAGVESAGGDWDPTCQNQLIRSHAQQVCLDTITAFAAAFQQKCGDDFAQVSTTLTSQLAGGDCLNVLNVRDEAALRDVCFPSLVTITCDQLNAAQLDPSCQLQLIRSQ